MTFDFQLPLALSLTLLCAGCANTDGGAACSPSPTDGLHPLGLKTVEVGTPAVLPKMFWVALATSGATSLAVGEQEQQVFVARLDAEGRLLDGVPARLASEALVVRPAAVWNGARFLVTWFDLDGGLRVTPVEADGTVGVAGPPMGAGEPTYDGMATASNGSETLVVWGTDGGDLHAARIGADGAWLDAAPLALPRGSQAQAARDGASFVVTWTALEGQTIRGARLSAAGAVLDPAGVELAAGREGALLPRAQGTSLVFNDHERIQALRLGADLAPLDAAPITLVDLSGAEQESPSQPRAARAGDGHHLVAWTLTNDVNEHRTMAQAFDEDFAPVGATLAGAHDVMVGLEGQSFLALGYGAARRERLADAGLGVADSGLALDPSHLLQTNAAATVGLAVASSDDGHFTAWSGLGLRGRFLDASGAPASDGAALLGPAGETWPGTPRAAWTGSTYLVAAKKADRTLEISAVAPGASSPSSRRIAGAGPVIGFGLACHAGTCFLAWSARHADHDELRGTFVAADGSPAIEEGLPLYISPRPSFTDDLVVLPLGDTFGLFWKNRGARLDPEGSSAALVPGLSLDAPSTRFVLAAGPDTLLAARWTAQSGAPATASTEVLRHDGTLVAALSEPIAISSAAWDGAAYVACSDETIHVITADGSTPASAPLGTCVSAAVASAAGGRTVAVDVAWPEPHGDDLDNPDLYAEVVERGVCE